jgi:hypothetical protein
MSNLLILGAIALLSDWSYKKGRNYKKRHLLTVGKEVYKTIREMQTSLPERALLPIGEGPYPYT